jgi:nicotinamide mononucleotide transporter PnuC
MFSIDNIIFSIAGQGVSLLEIIAVLSGLACVFLATKGKVFNFWMGYLYNILLFCLFFQKHLYASMLIQPISLAINIIGHYRWTHPANNEKDKKDELKITILTNKQRLMFLLIVVDFTLMWGFFLSKLDLISSIFPAARQPYLDACVAGFILLAQYLSAQKKIDCWGAWFIVNVTNVTLYIIAGLAFMPFVSTAYLILAFFGFAMWRKQMKEQ